MATTNVDFSTVTAINYNDGNGDTSLTQLWWCDTSNATCCRLWPVTVGCFKLIFDDCLNINYGEQNCARFPESGYMEMCRANTNGQWVDANTVSTGTPMPSPWCVEVCSNDLCNYQMRVTAPAMTVTRTITECRGCVTCSVGEISFDVPEENLAYELTFIPPADAGVGTFCAWANICRHIRGKCIYYCNNSVYGSNPHFGCTIGTYSCVRRGICWYLCNCDIPVNCASHCYVFMDYGSIFPGRKECFDIGCTNICLCNCYTDNFNYTCDCFYIQASGSSWVCGWNKETWSARIRIYNKVTNTECVNCCMLLCDFDGWKEF